ncbi:MAG TPA: ABC transporter ATP-binding protein [Acholeplasmataceae bacterium]|jgi:ABC-2 type transport system ATP-binding protein|nr:ABC transporter ATP-binding protein [Acholeplasmataceae bacterium]
MIRIDNLTKTYGKVIANQNVSFSVNDGQIAILLGPNGAGKTTTIKCISGLLRYKGTILIDDLLNKTVQAKRNLGYIPEMPAIYDLLTVSEHFDFIARAYKLEDYLEYANELLHRFELKDKQNKLGSELSKGMKQKLSICLALLPKPKNLIFDEPMVGLDPHAIKELKSIFRELKAEGHAILISTHMIDSLEDYWDIAHIMVEGKIAASKYNTQDNDLLETFFEITGHKEENQ